MRHQVSNQDVSGVFALTTSRAASLVDEAKDDMARRKVLFGEWARIRLD